MLFTAASFVLLYPLLAALVYGKPVSGLPSLFFALGCLGLAQVFELASQRGKTREGRAWFATGLASAAGFGLLAALCWQLESRDIILSSGAGFIVLLGVFGVFFTLLTRRRIPVPDPDREAIRQWKERAL